MKKPAPEGEASLSMKKTQSFGKIQTSSPSHPVSPKMDRRDSMALAKAYDEWELERMRELRAIRFEANSQTQPLHRAPTWDINVSTRGSEAALLRSSASGVWCKIDPKMKRTADEPDRVEYRGASRSVSPSARCDPLSQSNGTIAPDSLKESITFPDWAMPPDIFETSGRETESFTKHSSTIESVEIQRKLRL
eukprot:GSA25T00001720001.1